MTYRTPVPFLSGWRWHVFYLLLAACWVALWLMSEGMQSGPSDNSSPGYFLSVMTASHLHHAGFGILLGMWAAMSAGMMMPGFVPVLNTYEGLRESGFAGRAGFLALNSGYLTVWMGYSVIMATIHHLIQTSDYLVGVRTSWQAAALLLLLAGVYQLSSFKYQCLTRCRNPMTVFLARGTGGFIHTTATGMRFGLWCLGCCWMLMGIGLIGGLMTITWMALAMVLITMEKLPNVGRYCTMPVALLLIAAAVAVTFVNLN